MSVTAARGSWEDVFGACPDTVAEVAVALREVVLRLHPEAVEVARPGEKSVCFGFGEKKNSEAYLYLMPQKNRVNLGFFSGATMADPDGLMEGTGTALRHVKVGSVETAQSQGVAALIYGAVKDYRQRLGRG